MKELFRRVKKAVLEDKWLWFLMAVKVGIGVALAWQLAVLESNLNKQTCRFAVQFTETGFKAWSGGAT